MSSIEFKQRINKNIKELREAVKQNKSSFKGIEIKYEDTTIAPEYGYQKTEVIRLNWFFYNGSQESIYHAAKIILANEL